MRVNFSSLHAAAWLTCTAAVLPGCMDYRAPLKAVTVTFKPASDEAPSGEAAPAEPGTGTSEPAESGGVGTLTGQIVYGGDPPALPPLFGAGADVRDAAVCAAEPIANESLVVDPATKGIAHVFIYLEKAPKGGVSPPAEGDAIFDQRGCVFRPHALLVRAKQKVLILSDDPIAHNTHTFPNRNKPFNQGIPPNERNGVALTYAAAERMPVEVKCDYHPWMRAWHLPLDHGFAALTDAQGKFSIAGLPAGTHKFKIVHEGREIERAYSVTIKAGDNPLTITLGAEKFTAQGAPGKRLRITADGLVMR